jgi:dUTP pyrophosphatase
MKVKIKKLHKDAKVPAYANPGDAGIDLFAIKKYKIKPGQIGLIDTGLAFELPPKTVGLVWDKGSVAMKRGLKSLGGVLDEGYRGELTIGLVNLSRKTYNIDKGDKVAQLLIQKVERANIKEVKKLSGSIRGVGRFGSSGKK